MPGCRAPQVPKLEHDEMSNCCVAIPQAPGSSGMTFKLSPPSFSVAVLHPAIEKSPSTLSTGYERSSSHLFKLNLQTSYIRNLSLLI